MNGLELLALFAAGNLLVALTAIGFRRYLRREPRLLARREGVFELNDRALRVEAAQVELATSRTEQAGVTRRVADLDAKIAARVPLDDPPSTRIAYGLLGVLLTEGEAAVFFLLSAPVGFLGMPPALLACVSMPVAAIGVLMLHVIAGYFVTDRYRPARTVRRTKIGAALFGATVVVALWMILSGRNLNDANLVEQIAGTGLLMLAALLSITAAMCTLVATTLHEAEQDVHERTRLEQRANSYARHIDLLEKDIARLSDQAPASPVPVQATPSVDGRTDGRAPQSLFVVPDAAEPRPAASRTMGAITTIGLALVAFLAFGAPAIAQPARNAAPVVARPSLQLARSNACELLLDITTSGLRTQLQETVRQVARALPLIVDAFACVLVRLTPFSGDLFVSIQEFALPPADTVVSCASARAMRTATTQAVSLLYPKVAAAHNLEHAGACAAQRDQARRATAARRREALALVSDSLHVLAALPQRGPCTALYQAIDRALLRSEHLLVITDGVSTCAPPPLPHTMPVSPDGSLLLLLIPPSDPGTRDRANQLLGRLSLWKRLYPGGLALLAPEATPAFWQRLVPAQPGPAR